MDIAEDSLDWPLAFKWVEKRIPLHSELNIPHSSFVTQKPRRTAWLRVWGRTFVLGEHGTLLEHSPAPFPCLPCTRLGAAEWRM